MAELILAFFAVVGITLLGLRIFEYFYFRNRIYYLPLIVDLRNKNQDDAWEILESISLVRQKPGGEKVISELYILISETGSELCEDLLKHYLNAFCLPGIVFSENDIWYESYQNKPENDGEQPS